MGTDPKNDGSANNGIVHQGANKPATTGGGIKIGIRTGSSAVPANSLRAKFAKGVKNAEERRKAEDEQALTAKNRLALMLDVSGSMSGMGTASTNSLRKDEYLQQAYVHFVQACALGGSENSVSVAVRSFGKQTDADEVWVPLTVDQGRLIVAALQLTAYGGTPMGHAMAFTLDNVPLTRGVLISDGQPDSEVQVENEAKRYAAAEIPIDCVHIGREPQGEALLKRVAEMTHGIYIKFTDVEAFSRALTYLTPRFRAMLTQGALEEMKKQLGASEIVVNK